MGREPSVLLGRNWLVLAGERNRTGKIRNSSLGVAAFENPNFVTDGAGYPPM
jgi:hypothetical protein